MRKIIKRSFEVFVHYKCQKSAVPKAFCVVQNSFCLPKAFCIVQYSFCLPGISALPEIVVSKEQCVVAEKRGQMSESTVKVLAYCRLNPEVSFAEIYEKTTKNAK